MRSVLDIDIKNVNKRPPKKLERKAIAVFLGRLALLLVSRLAVKVFWQAVLMGVVVPTVRTVALGKMAPYATRLLLYLRVVLVSAYAVA